MSDAPDGGDEPGAREHDADESEPGAIPLDELAREVADEDETGDEVAAASDARDLLGRGGAAPEADPGDREDDSATGAREDAPLSDLAERVRERAAEGGGASEGADRELFEETGVPEVDSQSVWESLDEGADDEGAPGDLGLHGEAERVERDDRTAARTDYLVAKRDYCQRCEYFTDPPDVACTYDGSAIVEVTDGDHFRVRGCPKVEGGSDPSSLG
jgi:hypothetical protein